MGAALSRTFHTLRIRLILRVWRTFSPQLDSLLKRLDRSPGIPVAKPCTPYWAIPPSPIAQHGSDSTLPAFADVVVIGSGITGTAFARTLLDHDSRYGDKDRPLKVVMLEARDACSGATGRNGGHITPGLYYDYSRFKKSFGISTAKQIIRFRLAHLSELLGVAKEENLLQESQCREVETFDVFHDNGLYSEAKGQLDVYQRDMPAESAEYGAHEGAEAIKRLQLSPLTVGVLSTRAGAVHPYRLVTGILSRLLQSYSSHFHLFTHTPCTAISSSPNKYTITTPRGTLETSHVIHATNAWISHLLPSMRGKIIPTRATMSAQKPQKLSNSAKQSEEDRWIGARSFVFYPAQMDGVFDYLTQQPPTPSVVDSTTSSVYPPPAAELMFGGGLLSQGGNDSAFFGHVGNVDDRTWTPSVGRYLHRALHVYFDHGASILGDMENRDEDELEELNAQWSGIVGHSVDEMPWVGRVPEKLSGRRVGEGWMGRRLDGNVGDAGSDAKVAEGMTCEILSSVRLAPPGEWVAAGYSGEGMVHAWMSGKALAYMVLGLDKSPVGDDSTPQYHEEVEGGGLEEWFPDVFRVSEDRWRYAIIEDLFASYM